MAQTIPVDVPLGPGATGLAIGATVYALDGTTVVDTFSVTGWYEAPAGSGSWHHPGLTLSDAGAVVAVGTVGTELARAAVGAKLNDISAANVVTAIMAYAVETGVPLSTALQKIFATLSGGYLADDPEEPTNIIYYAPDGVTPRVEFDLTPTTREPA